MKFANAFINVQFCTQRRKCRSAIPQQNAWCRDSSENKSQVLGSKPSANITDLTSRELQGRTSPTDASVSALRIRGLNKDASSRQFSSGFAVTWVCHMFPKHNSLFRASWILNCGGDTRPVFSHHHCLIAFPVECLLSGQAIGPAFRPRDSELQAQPEEPPPEPCEGGRPGPQP